jgi:excinuclease ABC subunit B
MRIVIDETESRSTIQHAHNEANGIIPQPIVKSVADHLVQQVEQVAEPGAPVPVEANIAGQVRRLEKEMLAAAKELEFERAAELRDAISFLKRRDLGVA